MNGFRLSSHPSSFFFLVFHFYHFFSTRRTEPWKRIANASWQYPSIHQSWQLPFLEEGFDSIMSSLLLCTSTKCIGSAAPLDFPTDNFSKRRIGKDLQVCTRNTRLIKLSHFGIRKICENFKSNARPDRYVSMIYIYVTGCVFQRLTIVFHFSIIVNSHGGSY